MSNSYQQGSNDANSGKGPKDVRNLPSQAQQSYNAGYANSKK